MHTRVGIIGAGPAGLVLGHLLALAGIESIIHESRSRDYVERRVRAGVLEQGTVDLLNAIGVGDRMRREGLVHRGIRLRFDGEDHRLPISELTGGRAITVYGQQEVVKDLIRAGIESGGEFLFGAKVESIDGIDSPNPRVRYRHDGETLMLSCDWVAGCDGTHGVSRRSVSASDITVHEKEYPFAWLGILAEAAPSTDELIYAHYPRGFAPHSMRSPEISRLYIQVSAVESIDNWPDERIWNELHSRLALPGWSLNEGPIIEKGITTMRSHVIEPMRHGRLFLVGDAAHIVPATGAKGLNLAVTDANVLATALTNWYQAGQTDLRDAYSATCLRRVWRAEHFSWWMTSMLHRFEDDNPFDQRMQLSQLRYVCSSTAAATTLAENYVGLERV